MNTNICNKSIADFLKRFFLLNNVQFKLLNITGRWFQTPTSRVPKETLTVSRLLLLQSIACSRRLCSRRLRLSHSVTRSGYQSVLKMHCSLEDVSIIFNLLKPLKTPIEWGEGSCEVVHCSLEIRVNLNLKSQVQPYCA